MVRELVQNPLMLNAKSVRATEEDVDVARNLIDTLQAHLDRFSGMAAVMIGERKRIIAIAKGSMVIAALNPKILSKSGEYETEEECPLLGKATKVVRYKTIRLLWQDGNMKEHVALLDGFQAQLVQHLIDHCDGIVV